jgi:hypothetical protein
VAEERQAPTCRLLSHSSGRGEKKTATNQQKDRGFFSGKEETGRGGGEGSEHRRQGFAGKAQDPGIHVQASITTRLMRFAKAK